MDRAAALDLFALTPGATPEDVGRAYRALRKPLIKELNRHDAGAEPSELLAKLDSLDEAHRILQTPAPESASAPAPASASAGAPPTPTRVLSETESEAHASDAAKEPARPEPAGEPAPPATAKGTPTGSVPRSTGRVGLEPGAVLLGRYEIHERISHRPEGDTYRATDRVRQADVAVKVIDDGLVRDARSKALVKQGVLAASRLHHPNLARVLDLLPMQHTYVVAQELPPGANLWDLVHGEAAQPARFTPDLVRQVAAQATRALAYLHRATKHAALRPESVWVAEDGSVKVSDYGFEALHRTLRERRLSRSKLGTAYWAPEQYREEVAVDERSDQHALALILHEVLSGKLAMGRTVDIRSVRRDVPKRFTGALERALSSKPGRRFADMDAFGFAAFDDYEVEGAVRPAPGLRTAWMPTLCLLALVAAFIFSPLGKLAGDTLGDLVSRWHTDDAREARADLERRRLTAMSARLGERKESLDEASKTELARVRMALRASVPGDAERAALKDDLTQILTQLVESSARRATDALEDALKAWDEMENLPGTLRGQAREAIDQEVRALAAAPRESRLDAIASVVRRQAGAERVRARWREERAALSSRVGPATALRRLLEAEEALAIGDDAATSRAFDEAAATLGAEGEAARQAVARVTAFDPYEKQPRIAAPLDDTQQKACVSAVLGIADDLTDDDDLARVLDGLMADAGAGAKARHVVDPEGFWTLEIALDARAFVMGGTWRRAGVIQRLRVTVIEDRLLAAPYEMAADRGEGAPGQGDLVAAFAAAPRDARGLWCGRSDARSALPAPSFEEAKRTLRAGDLAARGSSTADGACVLVEGRRFEVADGAFEARVRVPGDVLGTWLRAHAASGLQSGPGAWTRVRTDGLSPRVHLLEPAADASLEPGSAVTVRAIVYDSNLETLEIAGEGRPLRHDDVYVLIEHPMTVPPAGGLTLPIRAVDAAGNETAVEWTWLAR